MSATVIRIAPMPETSKKELDMVPNDAYISRILRLQELLHLACKTLLSVENEDVAWPNELIDYHNANYRENGGLTYDEALDQLTEEQIKALGLD